MPGNPSSRRRRTTGSVITPRSSATSGQVAELLLDRAKSAAPGPRRHCPFTAVVFRAGTAQ